MTTICCAPRLAFRSPFPRLFRRHGNEITQRIRPDPRFHRPRTAQRAFSTTIQPQAWWPFGRTTEGRGKKLPPLASFLDGSAPRLVLKATNEPRLRCTEFDENGNVTLVNGEFKKSELIQMVGLWYTQPDAKMNSRANTL